MNPEHMINVNITNHTLPDIKTLLLSFISLLIFISINCRRRRDYNKFSQAQASWSPQAPSKHKKRTFLIFMEAS